MEALSCLLNHGVMMEVLSFMLNHRVMKELDLDIFQWIVHTRFKILLVVPSHQQ